MNGFFLIWGTVLVHPTDNALRPLLVSNATHVPFLIVKFGVRTGEYLLGLYRVYLWNVSRLDHHPYQRAKVSREQ